MYLRLATFLAIALYLMNAAANETTWHLIDGANLAIHEGGHMIMSIFGQFIYIMGGSFWQVFLPLVFAFYFLKKGKKYEAFLMLIWVGESLVNVGIYAHDAVLMELPLVGGENAIHDWNYILSHLNLLGYTSLIGGILKVCGWVMMFVGTALGMQQILSEAPETTRTRVEL